VRDEFELALGFSLEDVAPLDLVEGLAEVLVVLVPTPKHLQLLHNANKLIEGGAEILLEQGVEGGDATHELV